MKIGSEKQWVKNFRLTEKRKTMGNRCVTICVHKVKTDVYIIKGINKSSSKLFEIGFKMLMILRNVEIRLSERWRRF